MSKLFNIDIMLSKFSDHSFLKFRPSIITSAAIAASRLRLHLCPSWTPLLIKVTSYTWEQIAPCVSIMLRYTIVHFTQSFPKLVYYALKVLNEVLCGQERWLSLPLVLEVNNTSVWGWLDHKCVCLAEVSTLGGGGCPLENVQL